MKKRSITIILIVLIGFTLAADVTTVGSGSLNVYGSVGSGTIAFTVQQTNTTRIDLVNNTAIQPTGDGIVLGNWEFSASNQGFTVPYTVTYATTPLTSGSTTIAFEVIELNGTTVVTQSSNSTSFTAAAGSPLVTRDIAVRLEETVPSGAPAANNYHGSITITLTTGT